MRTLALVSLAWIGYYLGRALSLASDFFLSLASSLVSSTPSLLIVIDILTVPASWSRGNSFVSGVGGPRFKSRADRIGHRVANDLPPQQHFFERICYARRRNDAEMGSRKLVTRFGVVQRV